MIIFRSASRKNASDATCLTSDVDFISDLAIEFRSKAFAQQYVRRVVIGPRALHFPPRMSNAYAGDKLFFAESELLREICSEQSEILRISVITHADAYWQHGREAHDIVMPERASDLGQVGFIEISAVARRLEINPADLNIEGIFLWSHDQVRAIGAQFATDLVANVGRNGDHRGGHAHA